MSACGADRRRQGTLWITWGKSAAFPKPVDADGTGAVCRNDNRVGAYSGSHSLCR